MEKTSDEISEKIRMYRALKPEQQKKILGDLRQRIDTRAEESVSTVNQIEDIEKNLEQVRDRRKFISVQIRQQEERIPNMLAFDQSITELSSMMGKLLTEDKTLGYTIAGLETKISNLKNEVQILDNEQQEDEWLVKLFRAIPLPDRWNEAAIKLVPILQEIHESMEALEFSFHPLGGGRRMIVTSDWESLEKIPKLYLVSEVRPELDQYGTGRLRDLWSLMEYKFELRNKK